MQLGKLPSDQLHRLLEQLPSHGSEVIMGPKIGEDAAIIDYGDKVLVVKTDPITFATDMIGWYAVNINANDIACCGAKPRWFMATLLLPQYINESEIQSIFDQMIQAAESLDVTIIGGHTEITDQVSQPIVVGTMLGEAPKSKYVTTSGALPGDSIVLTQALAIEGTAILARESSEALLNKHVPLENIEKCKHLLVNPGISVVKAALLANEHVYIHSMHDPTEGGIATALYELAHAANVGVLIYKHKLPILDETISVCEALCLDPLGLLASGTLLITLAPNHVQKLLEALDSVSVPAYEIGTITSENNGVLMSASGNTSSVPEFQRDELARFFEEQHRMVIGSRKMETS